MTRRATSIARGCGAALLAILIGLGPAWGRLPEAVRRQLHKYAEYHVWTVRGQRPWVLVDHRPAASRIVVWEALPQVTRASDTKRIMAWVAQGGVLWFQDSRLAPRFGMQPAPLRKEQLRARKAHRGQYGIVKKFPGMATYALAPAPGMHAVLAGVSAVEVFLLKVGADRYSAVRLEPKMTPLLEIRDRAGAPVKDRVVAALMPYGKGTVIFKPLIFIDQHSGERFQDNLLEWSAGFGVPQSAAAPEKGL